MVKQKYMKKNKIIVITVEKYIAKISVYIYPFKQ